MKKTSRRKFGQQLAGAMAALPVTALIAPGQDKPTREKEKEKEKEKKKERPPGDDPPILVGGGGGARLDRGGSTYIWVHKTLVTGAGTLQPTPAANTEPQYEIPGLPVERIKADYHCYEILNLELGKYETHDGDDEGSPHDVKQRRKHCTRFYKK